MSFFQSAVINKYLKSLNKDAVRIAYNKFIAHFHNPVIQQNIRDSKEEQYQEGFLIDLFMNVLGYTKNPTPNFNLTTEYKNVKDAKKADGAIIINDVAKAVIELKGTDTIDLGNIETQAFGYKNNQPECEYIVTSNFEKLRFYIDNAIDYIEFNLFILTEKDFELLWLCLAYESILKDIPKKIKKESVGQENDITKKLYSDYSLFKRELHQNLVELNPQYQPLELFKKSQKLLDRFLFLLFAEDRELLPPNSVRLILNQWQQLKDLDEDVSLYGRFKKYFGYLNTGFKGKQHEVFAYNGGLFKTDDVLDAVKITDELLYKHTFKLSEYNFESEVDVNILGHIFENSLNELDEIKAQLEGKEIDKSKTKRKKDGVFYTPRYITKYIVENTVGKLCSEKKIELEITDEIYTNAKLRSRKRLDNLKKYRDWLLQITICDPACGSGAFLNQALDFLIKEHYYLDELSAKYNKDTLLLSDIENSILENNLFGVDLNEESVEIAKLSLWLRTARANRKLNDLNNNIKSGNSLIDDVEVAGDKAFNWLKEFPQVFEKGGFDVVIGNPPYVSSKEESFSESSKKYLIEKYVTSVYQIDLYILFLERSIQIVKSNGISSFIVPNSWLNNLFQIEARKFILDKVGIIEIVDMPPKTFEQANVDTIIISLTNRDKVNYTKLVKCKDSKFSEIGQIEQNIWKENEGLRININTTENVRLVLKKIEIKTIALSKFTEIARGVGVYHKRVGHTKELIASDPYQSQIKKNETFVPYIRGKNVTQWCLQWNNDSFISYGKWLAEPREPKFFEGERIILRQIPADRLIATFITEKFITDQSVFISKFNESSKINPKAVLAIISSTLMSFYFRNLYSEFDDLFPKLKLQHFKDLPIKEFSNENQQPFIKKANLMLSLHNELQLLAEQFQRSLERKFELKELSNKLQDWYSLTYSEFIKELAKKKIKLSLTEEAEWENYFLQESKKALELKATIDKTDKEIDEMVYELYELTEDEIKIVEGNNV